jgi:WYL domain
MPAQDTAAVTAQAVAVSTYRFQGRFRLHAPATAVRDVVSPSSGVVEPLDEHSCLLTVGSMSMDAMMVWLAVLGFPFEVVDPPELIEYARKLGALLTAAGQDPADR